MTGRPGFLLQLGRHQDLLKSYLLFLDLHQGNLSKGIDKKTVRREVIRGHRDLLDGRLRQLVTI